LYTQSFLKPEYVIISEVGDSWFNSQKLRLPNGAAYEIQVGVQQELLVDDWKPPVEQVLL
jgi:hypothetical protein